MINESVSGGETAPARLHVGNRKGKEESEAVKRGAAAAVEIERRTTVSTFFLGQHSNQVGCFVCFF